MTLIYFILILGVTVFVHEFGHFIFAKIFKVHVYEFSIGMGKKLFSFNRKNDETTYSIRLLPIGGYVRLAGEEIDDDENIPEDKKLTNKKAYQKFLILVFGAVSNFIFAIILLFFMGMIYGSTTTKPLLGNLNQEYPAYIAGLRDGDLITDINDTKIKTYEDLKLFFALNTGEVFNVKAKDQDGNSKQITVVPVEAEIEGENRLVYGISQDTTIYYGFISSIKYAFSEFSAIIRSMFTILGGLFTLEVGMENMSGPVGIYTAVGQSAQYGLQNVLYLVVLIGINVGVINLLPIPAFDGGRILFLIIEKIKGSKIDTRTENIIHSIFFILLMGLMLYLTFNDVMRLFK